MSKNHAMREALGLTTEVVGVVAREANTYALSYAGVLAVRNTNADALTILSRYAARIVEVSEDGIQQAMREYFHDCHQITEGAAVAPLAALTKERTKMTGKRVGLVFSSGNIDRDLYTRILSGG